MPSTRRAPLLLDGAIGTALLGRGLPPRTPAEAWLLTRPSEIEAIHRSHVAAGASLLLTCTTSLARLDDQRRLAHEAVRLARAASAPWPEGGAGAVKIAGAVGPAAAGGLDAAFEALAAAGVDLLWAETQWELGAAL